MIRRLQTDQRGVSIMEMLVTLAVGSILLAAIFGALDYSVKANGKVQDRVDSAQRGRAAMELITRQLRSQICLGPGYPAIPVTPSSDGNSITFFTDLGGDTGFGGNNGNGGSGKLQRRTITYSSGTVYETDYSVGGVIPTAPIFTLVRSNWVLADKLTQAVDPVTNQVIPFFRYFGFTPSPVLPNKWLNSTAPSLLRLEPRAWRRRRTTTSLAPQARWLTRSMNCGKRSARRMRAPFLAPRPA